MGVNHPSVDFESGRLVIRILHIDDSVSDECDKAGDVQAVFEDLVEDYIETCATIGKEPSKPFKGSFNVRIAPNLHRQAAQAATRRGESLNAWVARSIEHQLMKDHDRDAPATSDVTLQLDHRSDGSGRSASFR